MHHFVPAAYLARWATVTEGSPAKRVVYFHWANGRLLHSRISPKRAASQPGLYTRRHAPEGARQQIETEFFTPLVDNPGAQIIEKLVQGLDDLTGDERRAFALYLLSQRFRVPSYVEHLRAEASRGMHDIVEKTRAIYEEIRKPEDPAALEELIAAELPRMEEGLGIQMLPQLLAMSGPIDHIAGMCWKPYRFEGWGRRLLTSDIPVIFTKGLADLDCVIAMPLSPHVAFFAGNDRAILEGILGRHSPKSLAGVINTHVVHQAIRFIYADDNSQHRFVENRLVRPEQLAPRQYHPLRI
ncbi:MAG TPA: DUF4238 domain-containing protein [Burkholderiaceae bacterium]